MAISLIETDDLATKTATFPSSVAVVLQDKERADASRVTSTFTFIDAPHRGVILAKVKNYEQIRWRTVAGLVQWHRFVLPDSEKDRMPKTIISSAFPDR